MLKNKLVHIFTPTAVKSSEGLLQNQYFFAVSVWMDVQPARLSDAELRVFGITTIGVDVRRAFCDYDSRLTLTCRVVIDNALFDVRAVNVWPSHTELMLFPVQGASTLLFQVAGVSVSPLPGDVYKIGGVSHTLKTVTLSGTPTKSGTLTASWVGLVTTSGSLVRSTGTGDAAIAYSAFKVY